MSVWRWLVLALSLAAAALAIWQLEADRAGLIVEPLRGIGKTPATVWRTPDPEPAPVVVIAHGFAGSQQLMHSFAMTLAQAGYIAVTFDFEGHGANPIPMSGDVARIEGTTLRLMDQLQRVANAALTLPAADGRLALVGHSMASDIVVRQAVRDPRVSATVAVSMFSETVTAEDPRNLLIVTGAWEGWLAEESLRALRLASPDAVLGQTLGNPAAGNARRAVLAPGVEHVGVLYAPTTMRETRAWVDAVFGRETDASLAIRGGWIALLIGAVFALAWPLAGLLGTWQARVPQMPVQRGPFLLALLVAGVGTPLVLWPFETRFLPVLVADYLALHFALYGFLVLLTLYVTGALKIDAKGRIVWALAMALPISAFCIFVFGGILDRYVASFWPTPERLAIIAAIALGAIPFMLADAALTEGGRGALWRSASARAAALASLGLAVALDFEGLFFLVIILPVILLYFVLFGTIAGWIGRATWRPFAGGFGLGLFLAWALGVTFPLFAA